MYIPIDILIEQERKRKELETEAARPALQLPLPPPDYLPEINGDEPNRGYVVVDEEGTEEKSNRGIIIIEM